MDKGSKILILNGLLSLLGAFIGAGIPIYYSAITEPTETYWINKGNEYYNISAFDDAIRCYENAIDLNPKSAAWESKTRALIDLKKYQEGISTNLIVQKLNPNNEALSNAIANDLFSKGSVLIEHGKYDEAILTLNEAIQINQNQNPEISKNSAASLFFQRGINLYDQGKYDESVLVFEKAIQYDPNYDESHIMKYLALGKAAKTKADRL